MPPALEIVLTPPQRERLRRVPGFADPATLELQAHGWHRYAILSPDRVLLLPRDHRWVPGLDREAAALGLLRRHRIAVPELLDRIDDEELWPYPVSVVSRLDVRSWAGVQDAAGEREWARMLTGLGRLIGSWHAIDTAMLPVVLTRSPGPSPDRFEARIPHLVDLLIPGRLEAVAAGLAAALRLPTVRVDRWLELISPCLDLAPVLVHRDLNEGQVMIDADGEVSGVIDWENARLDHPLSDLDFGEWGPGVFTHEAAFPTLRRRFWDAYVAARGVALPDWRAVHLLMTIVNAPPPEGPATAWTPERRERTLDNLRAVDAEI